MHVLCIYVCITYYVYMCVCMYVCIYRWVGGLVCVCVCVCVCVRARASNYACFCICGGFRFPHTPVYHQQIPTLSISADREMDDDKLYTVREAFQFTLIFVMNECEF